MPFSPSMCFFTAWLPSPHGALPAHGRGTLLQDTTQWQVLHTVHRERWGFWSGQGRSRYTLLFYWTSLSHHSLSAFQKHREVWGLLRLVLWRKLKQGDKNIGGEPLGVFVVRFCFVFFFRLGHFLPILNQIHKCRTLNTYNLHWKSARLVRATTVIWWHAEAGKKDHNCTKIFP